MRSGRPKAYETVQWTVSSDERRELKRAARKSARTSILLVISISLCAFDEPIISAERAITLARWACWKEEKSLIKSYGEEWRTKRKDWQALLKDKKWEVYGHANGVFFQVSVMRSGGRHTKCGVRRVD